MKKLLLCLLFSCLLAFLSYIPITDAFAKDNSEMMEAIPEAFISDKSPGNINPVNDTEFDVPVLLYHHVKPKKFGEKYSVTPEEFESDLIFLKEQGLVTVTVSELILFKKGDFGLPERPVIITFDDGRYNNYKYVFPLLQKYKAKASFFIIGSYIEKFSDGRKQYDGTSYMNFDNLKEMASSGLCDIQNHSYDLHDWTKGRTGVDKKKGESLEEYKKALEDDIGKNQQLLKENCGVTPSAFAYPFGVYNTDTEKILADLGFSAVLKAEGGQNHINRSGDTFLRLNRIERTSGETGANYFKRYFSHLI